MKNMDNKTVACVEKRMMEEEGIRQRTADTQKRRKTGNRLVGIENSQFSTHL